MVLYSFHRQAYRSDVYLFSYASHVVVSKDHTSYNGYVTYVAAVLHEPQVGQAPRGQPDHIAT